MTNHRARRSRGALAAGLLWAVSAAALAANPAAAREGAAMPPARQWEHYPTPPSAPANAPNILIVLTDDVGFGSSSTFGGLIPTPNLDRLADGGLRYTQFHTTAMCSPTRAALLTGRNHHAVNMGAIGNMSLDRDGYTSVMPRTAATIGKVLGLHGYHTAWIGKNHNTPLWEDSPLGPFDRWPNGFGFDYFYGFNGSQTNQFFPALIENRNQVPVPEERGYILEKDLADHAIDWLRKQQSLGAGAPFLLYYAPGTAHAPLQAPQEWLDRFRGRFDEGWDAIREKTYRRQLETGTIPPGTELTPRPPQIPAWSSLTEEEKRFSARLMEAYAAMLAFSDDQFGRIVDELKRSGRFDNTLILFIEGDNGAAAESLHGEFNEITMYNQSDTRKDDLAHSDLIGGPESQPVPAVGWAWAMNSPFQWSKQVASHFGGTRNGLVVSWPAGIEAKGEVRPQFHHVIDIAPTLYQLAGIEPDPVIDGVEQQPIDGISMAYSFRSGAAPSRRHSQYFEMLGNRAFYQDGWVAATTPRRMPWAVEYLQPDYDWELYHVADDFSQAHDLADKEPRRLEEMKRAFTEEAARNKVLPVDDSFISRFSSRLRPSAFDGGERFVFYPSSTIFPAQAFPELGAEWSVTADLSVSRPGASVPVIVRGDRFGGWGLFVEQGRVRLVYRPSHIAGQAIEIASAAPLPAGEHRLAVSMARRQDGSHRLALAIDGQEAGSRELAELAFSRVDTAIGRQGEIPLLDLAGTGGKGVEIREVRVEAKRH